MTITTGKRDFGASLRHGIEASKARADNIKIILDLINDVKKDIEEFSQRKVTLELRDSAKHTMLKAAAYYSTFDDTNPMLQKPTNQVIFFLSTIDETKKEDLTVLEYGKEGFPCTIYVDGNRFTSADVISFENSIDELLSSPSTGEKLQRLLGIDGKSIV